MPRSRNIFVSGVMLSAEQTVKPSALRLVRAMASTVTCAPQSASLERAIHSPAAGSGPRRLWITRSCDDERLRSADSHLVARLGAGTSLNGLDVAATGRPPRLSRPAGFWVIATSVLCVSAFLDSAEFPLRPPYAERDQSHLAHDHDRLRSFTPWAPS